MSGVVKSVKKVFKKIGKAVRKIAKPVAIAAGIYFTAGLAMSAFPATQAIAAGLPGFAGSGGAGTGIFSKVAGKMGLGGGLQAGAATANAATAATAAGKTLSLTSPMIEGTGSQVVNASLNSLGLKAGATEAVKQGGMSLTNKLLLAQMGTSAIAGFMQPTIGEQFEERAKFRGSYYGSGGSYDEPAGEPEGEPEMSPMPNQRATPAPRLAAAPTKAARPNKAVDRDLFGEPSTSDMSSSIEDRYTKPRQLFG